MHATPGTRRRLTAAAGAVLVVAVVATAVTLARTRGSPTSSAAPGTGTPGGSASTGGTDSARSPAGVTPSRPAAASPAGPLAGCAPWDCAQQRRFAAAAAVVRTRPGQLGITVLDRRTGAVWRSGTSGHVMWASSTPKLALATSLLERARAGELTLDATARRQIDAMLAVSDDDAADALWDRYGGERLVPRFRAVYGMTGLGFVPGFPRRWGFLKCSPADLQRLMAYVLGRLDPADREHVVAAMRTVGAVQRWGVWAAGPAQRPGTKNGWSVELDGGRRHWCVSSVGFAGTDARYVVAVMHDLPAGSSVDAGVHAVSDVVATVFGAPTPAPVSVPDPGTGR